MHTVPNTHVRLRGNWLFVEEPPIDWPEAVPLAFGCGFDPQRHRLSIGRGPTGPVVEATPSGEDRTVQLYPPYSERETYTHDTLGAVELELWAINAGRERQIAQSIVSRTHYLHPPTSGLFVGCRVANGDQQEAMRARARDSETLPPARYRSGAWSDPTGRVIACAILDDLVFGVPTGRDEFAGRVLGDERWRENLR